ncbi:MAG: hypothetical protein JWL72_870 [Ilumatobacteraceae bacterium]|nr:hypothetical protein [Ilumatobacteraceae bacterium]
MSGELDHQAGREQGIDASDGPPIGAPHSLQLGPWKPCLSDDAQEPTFQPTLTTGVDESIEQGTAVVDAPSMPSHDCRPEALLAEQLQSDGRVDRILDLCPIKPEQRSVEDQPVGRETSNALDRDRVRQRQRQACRSDDRRCREVTTIPPHEHLGRLANEPVQSVQSASRASSHESGSFGVAHRCPRGSLPRRHRPRDCIRSRAGLLDQAGLNPATADIAVHPTRVQLPQADGAELGRRDPRDPCIALVHPCIVTKGCCSARRCARWYRILPTRQDSVPASTSSARGQPVVANSSGGRTWRNIRSSNRS